MLVVFICGGTSVGVADGIDTREGAEKVVPSLLGLEMREVSFTPVVLGPHANLLMERARKKLEAGGLRPRETSYEGLKVSKWWLDPRPALLLRMEALPSQECPGKWSYIAEINLNERAVIERSPGRTLRVTTWSWGGKPRLLNEQEITLEQMQKDVDELLDAFVSDYKRWNKQ